MNICTARIWIMVAIATVVIGVLIWTTLYGYRRTIDRYAKLWKLDRGSAIALYAPARFRLGRWLIWLAAAPVLVMGVAAAAFSLGNGGPAAMACTEPVPFGVSMAVFLTATIYCGPLSIALTALGVCLTPRAFIYRQRLAGLRPEAMPAQPTQMDFDEALLARAEVLVRTRLIAFIFFGVAMAALISMTAAHLPAFIFTHTRVMH